MRQAPFICSPGAVTAAVVVILSLIVIGVGATLITAHEGGTWATVVGAGDRAPVRPRPQSILGVYQTLINGSESTAHDRQRDRERLSSYGWVDRSRGVVHIPIERAMAMVAKEGL